MHFTKAKTNMNFYLKKKKSIFGFSGTCDVYFILPSSFSQLAVSLGICI